MRGTRRETRCAPCFLFRLFKLRVNERFLFIWGRGLVFCLYFPLGYKCRNDACLDSGLSGQTSNLVETGWGATKDKAELHVPSRSAVTPSIRRKMEGAILFLCHITIMQKTRHDISVNQWNNGGLKLSLSGCYPWKVLWSDKSLEMKNVLEGSITFALKGTKCIGFLWDPWCAFPLESLVSSVV